MLQAISSVRQSGEIRAHLEDVAEFSVQVSGDQTAIESVVARKAEQGTRDVSFSQVVEETLRLGGLTRSVNAFEDYEETRVHG